MASKTTRTPQKAKPRTRKPAASKPRAPRRPRTPEPTHPFEGHTGAVPVEMHNR